MSLSVRYATAADLGLVARLAGGLVRMHHAFDPLRFMSVPGVEAGYERFLGRELSNQDAIVLVAEYDGKIAGYAYGTVEPRDWNALLDAAGALHDVFVDEHARRKGAARLLVLRMMDEFQAKGVPRVVLHAATPNAAAIALFASLGFRHTMVEMTREVGE